MGERITVIGGTDSTIAVTLDGSQAMTLANQFSKELQDYYSVDRLNFLDVAGAEAAKLGDKINYGVITDGGNYTAGNGYDYIVAGGYNAVPPTMGMTTTQINNLNLLNEAVTINSAMNSSQFIRVLSGNLQNFTYNAGQESGQLAAGNVGNSVTFNGNTVNGGNWNIATGQGNDTIVTGSGNSTVNASTGANSIDITAGQHNEVNSEGQDSIFASRDSNAQNSVTLTGGFSKDYNATVNINKGASVTDLAYYNTVTVGGGSTIQGGNYGSYTFDGSYDSNMNTMSDGQFSTITATGDLTVIHGDTNTINASKSLTLLNGVGVMEANVNNGVAVAYGASELNYTLNATGNNSGLFVADAGNETLNASGSTASLQIYANTIVGGGGTNFVASGGSGDDILSAGTGNSTFSGGGGHNLFMFTKETAEDGKTVITDFSKTNDKIALYNYGLDNNSLAQLLDNSKNDANGNAVLNLNGHSITVEGVSTTDLNVDQFSLYNAPKV